MKTRKHLIELLEELSSLEDSFFKSRAYKNACIALRSISDSDFDEWEDFTDLEGIGSGINKKILEYKSTGQILKLISLRQENSDYLDTKLYKVRKTFITKRIPYALATEYIVRLHLDRFHIAGSYRREKELIGDIDVLIEDYLYDEVTSDLSRKYEVISSGSYKSSFLIDKVNNIQLDVISITPEDAPFQLLYLTGSKEFNIKMRAHAKKLGYRLNQEGLYDLTNEIYVHGIKTESDIFKILDMEYVEPKNR